MLCSRKWRRSRNPCRPQTEKTRCFCSRVAAPANPNSVLEIWRDEHRHLGAAPWRSRRSHCRTSSKDAVTMRLPSGLKAALVTPCSWPLRDSPMGLPVSASHSRAAPSSDTVMMRLLSGLNVALISRPSWPRTLRSRSARQAASNASSASGTSGRFVPVSTPHRPRFFRSNLEGGCNAPEDRSGSHSGDSADRSPGLFRMSCLERHSESLVTTFWDRQRRRTARVSVQAAHRDDAGSPGSRPRSFCTCQVLRPRRVDQALAMMRLFVLPSALETASAPGFKVSRLNGWPMPSPTDASSPSSRTPNARLGADVDRYSFIVVDLHHLLLAGLPAHF